MNKRQKMTRKVVEFLCECGELPPLIKSTTDERISKAEKRLINKLVALQGGLESKFIRALQERGYIPANSSDRKKLVSDILDIPFSKMSDVMAKESIDLAKLGRQLAFDDLVEQGIQIDVTGFDEKVLDYIQEKTYQFSEETFSNIQGDFIDTLSQAYTEGIGNNEAIDWLRHDFKNLRHSDLRSIARTEIQNAQNEGINQTMQEYGGKFKQWISADDGRTRESHLELHGEVRRIDEPYSNGLMFPTDRDGDISEWISCRCRQRPYIPAKGEVIMDTPYYP